MAVLDEWRDIFLQKTSYQDKVNLKTLKTFDKNPEEFLV